MGRSFVLVSLARLLYTRVELKVSLQDRTSCLSPTRTSATPCSGLRASLEDRVSYDIMYSGVPTQWPHCTDYDTRQHEAGVSLDGLRDPALHVVRRRPWARGMNSASMKYYEELIRSTVGDLLSSLRQRTNDTVDISAWMTFFG